MTSDVTQEETKCPCCHGPAERYEIRPAKTVVEVDDFGNEYKHHQMAVCGYRHSTQPPPIEAGLVECVARAMCVDAGFDPDEIMANDGPRWKYYAPGATAAITALSAHRADVTEAMERQGVAEALAYGFDGFEPKHVRAIYQAMTKEAG